MSPSNGHSTLWKVKSIVSLASAMLFIAAFIYFVLKYWNYLEANSQGICWAEGRQLDQEELKLRGIKALMLKNKKISDDWNRESDSKNSFWKVIKKDIDPSDLYKLRLSYPAIPEDYGDRDTEKLMSAYLGMVLIDPNNWNKDDFYRKAIQEKYMFVQSESPWAMYRTSSYHAYTKQQLEKQFTVDVSILDRMQGFGTHYFFLQEMVPSDKDLKFKTVSVYSNYYAVNNCGTSIFASRSTFARIGFSSDMNGNPIGRERFNLSESIVTMFREFIKGV